MAENEIKKIMEKRELLRQELEKIDNFLDLYRELTGTEAVRSEPSAATDSAEPPKSHGRKRTPGTAKPSDVGPMARRILLDNGKPMTRSELLKALEERDVVLAGEDKAKYLGTILWRMKEAFINLEGFGYWPKDKPFEPANYFPIERMSDDDLLDTLDARRIANE
jgi:hypothetical protein